MKYVTVGTVDSFQGQERDIIIISCVRANKNKEIGFLKDRRRLNVSITRAKHQLLIYGHKATLQTNPLWKTLIR